MDDLVLLSVFLFPGCSRLLQMLFLRKMLLLFYVRILVGGLHLLVFHLSLLVWLFLFFHMFLGEGARFWDLLDLQLLVRLELYLVFGLVLVVVVISLLVFDWEKSCHFDLEVSILTCFIGLTFSYAASGET